MSQISPPSLKYPVKDPKKFGSHYWYVMHNTAANYPDKPSRTDRIEQSMFLKSFIRNLPCKTPCVGDSFNYIHDNPPDLSSKKGYFKWTVDFHNWNNKKNGRQEQYAGEDLLEDEKPCDNCSVSPSPSSSPEGSNEVSDGNSTPKPAEQSNNGSNIKNQDLKERLETYKGIAISIVDDACKDRKVPPPEIIFNTCPDNSGKSCIRKSTKTIYLDPNNFSIKTVFHELDHYFDLVENKPVGTNSDEKASKYAYEIIEKNFPYDNPSTSAPSIGAGAAAGGDEFEHDDGQMMAQPARMGEPVNRYQDLVKGVYGQPSSDMSTMPQFQQAMQEIQKEEMKDNIRTTVRNTNSGVLSHLDGLYEYPAGIVGMKAADLNLVHTPVILSNVVMTIVETFTTPIMSAGIFFFTGIVMMLSGILVKDRIPLRDLVLIEMLGSLFFWDVTRNLNPKKIETIKTNLKQIRRDITHKRFSWRSLIETPKEAIDHAMGTTDDIQSFTPGELGRINELRGARKGFGISDNESLQGQGSSYTLGNKSSNILRLNPYNPTVDDKYM